MAEYADTISRQAAIKAIKRAIWDKYIAKDAIDAVCNIPSAQPEGWMERNKDRILQAGKEGREVEFRISGRLFAIREKAQ